MRVRAAGTELESYIQAGKSLAVCPTPEPIPSPHWRQKRDFLGSRGWEGDLVPEWTR